MIGLNSFALKIIAIVTMLIDHVGAIFFPRYLFLRVIGRIAFPIFCFLLVEGYFHTSNLKRYITRLGIFALVAEIPFNLAFSGHLIHAESRNVFFTLFLGMIMLYFIDRTMQYSVWIRIGGTLLLLLAADWLRTDYGSMGLVMILCFYLTRNRIGVQFIFVTILNFLMGLIQAFGAVAMIPIALYNGKRGLSLKYIFYIFYPAHLLILYLVRYIVL